jgi:3-dehydroquinate synthase
MIINAPILDLHAWLPETHNQEIVIITDHKVKQLYALLLQNALQNRGYNCLLLSFPAGEKYKNHKTKQMLETTMLQHSCRRDCLILALGGGVVGDVAGFIAATYHRGVAYIQIPTTLLAMVDSSIGGKTGINTPQGKNLIGAIYQPKRVIIDLHMLQSLPKKQLINGLIEAVKIFLTHDATSFQHCIDHLANILKKDPVILNQIITQAIKIKADIVRRDETEQAERALLNFGHTIGHALEKISHYRLLHGYAVAYGILVEATISMQLGLLTKSELLILKNFFKKIGIHGKDLQQYDIHAIINAMQADKKIRAGQVRFALLSAIGHAYYKNNHYLHPVDEQQVIQAFKHCIED